MIEMLHFVTQSKLTTSLFIKNVTQIHLMGLWSLNATAIHSISYDIFENFYKWNFFTVLHYGHLEFNERNVESLICFKYIK